MCVKAHSYKSKYIKSISNTPNNPSYETFLDLIMFIMGYVVMNEGMCAALEIQMRIRRLDLISLLQSNITGLMS